MLRTVKIKFGIFKPDAFALQEEGEVIKMNYYFIDFENVHSEGFSGVEALGENDTLYLMFTEYCKMLSIEALEKICRRKIKLEVIRVGTGTKNALDFQLASFMGYIIAKNEGRDSNFYIVSKDTGFNPLTEFWKVKGVNVKIMPNFSSNADAKKTEPLKKADPAAVLKPSPASVPNEFVKPIPKSESNEAAKPKKSQTVAADSKSAAEPEVKIKAFKSKSKKSDIRMTTKEELLNYLSNEEYSDRILEIINNYKTIRSIVNALDKEFRDSQKSGAIYKKLKPLLKERKKN